MIRKFGTCDSYSTERGEFAHRYPKKWWHRSPKRNVRKDIARHERKIARARAIRHRINEAKRRRGNEINEQKMAARNPDIHHYIGINQNCPVSILPLSQTYPEDMPGLDPLGKNFMMDLRNHLLPRLKDALTRRCKVSGTSLVEQGDPITLDPSLVSFKDYRIFSHKIIRVKYTTYDVRRDEDVIHVDSHVCNVMLHDPQHQGDPTTHPYLYARVLGIYHAYVSYAGEIAPDVYDPNPIRMEFLHVRWYNLQDNDPDSPMPLDRLTFPPLHSPSAASFIEPEAVLRAAHIIPRFFLGRTHQDCNGQSQMAGDGEDWKEYYVNRFVDRDMFMRYQIGMAIGHLPRHLSKFPLKQPSPCQVTQNLPSSEPLPDQNEAGSVVDGEGEADSDETDSEGEETDGDGEETDGSETDGDGEETDGEEMGDEEDTERNDLDIVMFGH
ncbi:hypothetical protein H1R20_g5002, partial [Candolleomyces eurysporus]